MSYIPGQFECGRVESNHHSARQRLYRPRSSPVLSVRMDERGGRPDSNRHREAHDLGCCRYTTATTNGDDRTRTGGLSPDKRALSASELRPQGGRWKAGSAPRNRRQRRCRRRAPEPAVAHRHSCQRVSAPPPPHRSALEACRSQLHVRARALHRPLFRHFLGPPVGGPILSSAGGIRTHGLELMRLARTAAPLPRSKRPRRRSRNGLRAGIARTPQSGRQESNLRSPAPEAGGVAISPTARRPDDERPRRGSNPQLPG